MSERNNYDIYADSSIEPRKDCNSLEEDELRKMPNDNFFKKGQKTRKILEALVQAQANQDMA